MAEAALEAVRRALQEFPAAARGEWTLTGRPREDSAKGAWGAGNSDYVCMSARPLATVSCVPFSSWLTAPQFTIARLAAFVGCSCSLQDPAQLRR